MTTPRFFLTYSNRTEELLAALCAAVRAERAAGSAFAPVHLVVPNRNLETYVKFGLAEALGVAGNLEVTFLERLTERLAQAIAPDATLIGARAIEGHLLALFHDEGFLAAPVFAPVREYLLGAGSASDAVDRRRAALAAELGRLYEEYGASRPELLAAWPQRAVITDAVLRTAEAWQRPLWLAVSARAAGRPGRALLLGDLARALEATPVALGGALHVFGVSYIARTYHHLLGALARSTPVRLYTLNPCREFWEDVETVPELRRRLRRKDAHAFPSRTARQPALGLGDDPFGLEDPRENLALRLWGRPGRENIRLLGERTAGDFTGRFVASRGATLLARLQDDILDRVVPEAPVDQPLDGSLVVLPCPGVRRELEVIAAEIWRAVEADPTLRLNQIAVVIPEAVKDQYLAHVGAVFAEAHDLPHTVVDLPLGRASRIGEALAMLLELPFGAFTRREVLPLITHPAVMGRFPDARPAEWLRLAEELGIVHGADHGDHAGTYIERDVLNWDQGVKRIALGALIDEGSGGAGRPVTLDGQEYLPVGRVGDERRSALEFCLLVRSLINDARFAAGQGGPRLRPLPAWCEFVRGLIAAYLVPAGPEDEALLDRCLTELEKIEALPLDGTPISFRIAADLMLRTLDAASGGRGQYLAHGVTVTSFVPMRAVPFRHIFVAGLGDRNFPSGVRRSELDLRGAERYAGDVTPRQRDLYMFLETLLSARERLVLSYVARDELSGAPLLPSAVILELREILASGYLAGAALAAWDGERPPLRRYDDEVRRGYSRLATREAQAKALGRSLRQALPAGAALPDLGGLRRDLPPAIFTPLAARLEAHEAPGRARRGAAPGKLVVPLQALRWFLEDPLQGSARFRLRMRETVGDEELIDREDEAFESDRLVRATVQREAMLDALLAGAPDQLRPLPDAGALAAAFAARAREAELRGLGPTGLFARAASPAQLAVLSGWRAGLEALGRDGQLATALVRLGRPTMRTPHAARALPPLQLEIAREDGPLVVEVVGRSELQIEGAHGAGAVVLAARRELTPVGVFRDRLRMFVDHVVLAASGDERARTVHVINAVGDQHTTASARLLPVPASVARDYLRSLIGDLVAGATTLAGWASGLHPYLLPHEAVFEARKKGTSIADEVEKLRDHYFELAFRSFSSVNGPVPQAVERHEPPEPDVAARLAAARFDLYFDVLEEDKAS